MNEMKTLTIGDQTFEVVDEKARSEIKELKEKGTGATAEQLAQIEQNKNDISQLSEQIVNGTGTGGTGISTTAKDLMITLFRKALYNENVSGLIDSLDEVLSGGSVDVPDDGGGEDTPTITDDISVSDGVMTILSVGSDITVSDGVMTIA